ncbi:MAG: hypothetical protein WA771_15845 [Chthoniobacterales bacterium]
MIEVTLAIGVISVALIPMLGLIPTGLESFDTSLKRAAALEIADRITADIRQTDPDELATLYGGTGQSRQFDNQGNPVGPNDRNGVFKARARLSDNTGAGAAGRFGSKSNLRDNNSLMLVEIEIGFYPEGAGSSGDPFSDSDQLAARGDLFNSYAIVADESPAGTP